MPIIKNECDKDFVIVPNELAQLAQKGILSYEAAGVLIDMISRPNNWIFYKDFYQCAGAGIRIINRIFKELQNSGYLKIECVRAAGKIKDRVWCVSNKPIYKTEQNVNDTKRYANETLSKQNAHLQIKTNTNTEKEKINKKHVGSENDPCVCEEKIDDKKEEKQKKRQEQKESFTNEFDSVIWWDGYPRRAGTENKAGGREQYIARRREGEPMEKLRTCAANYLEHCKKEGCINTPYVMQASRFFGKKGIYLEYLEEKKQPVVDLKKGEDEFYAKYKAMWGSVADKGN
jgi:hypothetical protein